MSSATIHTVKQHAKMFHGGQLHRKPYKLQNCQKWAVGMHLHRNGGNMVIVNTPTSVNVY